MYEGQATSRLNYSPLLVEIEKRKNYNTGSEEGKVLACPPEKDVVIMDVFRHFGLV